VKLNTDGSFLNGVGGTGMVLRDQEEGIIFTSCRHLLSCSDALESEILAIKEGLSLALQWSSLRVDIESDCLESVSMVKSGERNKSKYAFMIREIKECMEERSSSITHIQHSENSASHFMANFGRSQDRTAVWPGSGPEDVLDIIRRDCNT
jgi:ribonuclease HI